MKKLDIKNMIKEELDSINWENRSRLNTKGFIEPEQMKSTLIEIYHIISGNRRDYLNIPNSLIIELKKFKDSNKI